MRPIVLAIVSLIAASPAAWSGEPTPAPFDAPRFLGTPVLYNADAAPESGGLRVTFRAAEWPSVNWRAPADIPWDLHETGLVAFDVFNPGDAPVSLCVRADDDPSADGGPKHSYTGNATPLAPHGRRTFVADLGGGGGDPMIHGMQGAPTLSLTFPGTGGMAPEALRTLWNGTDPHHIRALQLFLHNTASDTPLVIERIRILPPPKVGPWDKIVDGYGQYTRAEWPGKVHADSDIAAARRAEVAQIARHPALSERDLWGGWMGGKPVAAPGRFFHAARSGGKWWLVTPAGNPFLSFGANTVTYNEETIVSGDVRKGMFAALPDAAGPFGAFYGTASNVFKGPLPTGAKTFDFYQANLYRKYGTGWKVAWGDTTINRFRSWGFNTIGNWSDERLERTDRMPYTASLYIGGSHKRVSSGNDYWQPMHDPFDPQFALDCAEAMRLYAPPAMRADPWCIGYFADNELSWGGDGNAKPSPPPMHYGLAYNALRLVAADSPAKRAFVAQLKVKYSTVDQFNAAWGTKFSAWADLDAPYTAPAVPPPAMEADMSAYLTAFARAYFTTMRAAIKTADPNHLYLGCRFATFTPEAIKEAAAACDLVSLNVYATSLAGVEWDFTDSLGKPCLLSEYHFGALDRGMFHPGLVPVKDQKARGEAYRSYVHSIVSRPAFVGAHYFQYTDEPLTGRSLDGENFGIGFVSVTDAPYPELVEAARETHRAAYAWHLGGK